jgi:hypothetical protein
LSEAAVRYCSDCGEQVEAEFLLLQDEASVGGERFSA